MSLNKATAGTIIVFFVVGMLIGDWFLPPDLGWYLTLILLVLVFLVIGLALLGRIGGVLINEQNLYSLSRFQMALWSVLILSGYIVLVVWRIKIGNKQPLDVTIDPTLWALMGISTASLVGSPLIATVKKQKMPAATETAKIARTLVDNTNSPTLTSGKVAIPNTANDVQQAVENSKQGILYANPTPVDASLFDIFEGEEIGNAAYADVGKIQMFLFTIILGLVYGASLISVFSTANAANPPSGLPLVTNGMLALLGISHAGFLANKGVDHTKQ